MDSREIVRMDHGSVALSANVLMTAGISPGDAIVVYQVGDEIHIQRQTSAMIESASGL